MILRKAKGLDYWKKKLLEVLNKAPMEKSLKDILFGDVLEKSLPAKTKNLLIKARGYAPGTIREWSGKKYKKLSSGKWMRTYTGTGEKGEQQAIRNVMKKIQNASSMEELSKIISANMQRFKDEDGKTLPIVSEFMKEARGTEVGRKTSKKVNDVSQKNKPQSRKDKIKKILADTGIGSTSSETVKLYDSLSNKDKKMLSDKYYIRPKTMDKYRESSNPKKDKPKQKIAVKQKVKYKLGEKPNKAQIDQYRSEMEKVAKKKLGWSEDKIKEDFDWEFEDQTISNYITYAENTPEKTIDEYIESNNLQKQAQRAWAKKER